jgi:hypothetical protein
MDCQPGYGVLGYPQTWDSFAWGGAIGIAAALAAASAVAVAARVARLGSACVIVAFLAAFAVYELALYAASFVLPTGVEAFSPPVVWRILYVNAIALVGLLALHRLALATSLIAGGSQPAATPAAA